MDFCVSTSKGAEPDLKTGTKEVRIGRWWLNWQPSGNLEELDHQQASVLAIGTLFGSLRRSAGLRTGDSGTLGRDALASNGSFAVVIPKEQRIIVVTDAGGSIPVYWGEGPKGLAIGTLVHHVAHLSGLQAFDRVSVVDFLLNETVCYPYTWFEGIRVVPPGSVCTFSAEGMDVHTYWRPSEPSDVHEPCNVRDWGERLHDEVQRVVMCGLERKTRGRVFFSGGEDSRAVTSLVPDEFDCTPTTVLDSKNREYRFAKWATRGLGRTLEWIKRPEGFYRAAIAQRIDTVGPGRDFRHIHIFGPVAEPYRDADVLLGGYLADTLFKTNYMSNISRIRGRPDRLASPAPDQIKVLQFNAAPGWFREDLVAAARERRLKHHKRLKQFRPQTAGNWHALWPLSPVAYAHYLACLRIGPRVVEPFLCSRLYRLAARMPDECRVNRRAFAHAFARKMGVAGWLPTTSGSVPRLRGWPKYLFAVGFWRLRRWKKKVLGGSSNWEGPWSQDSSGWYPVKPARHFASEAQAQLNDCLASILSEERKITDFFCDRQLPDEIRVRAMTLAFSDRCCQLLPREQHNDNS